MKIPLQSARAFRHSTRFPERRIFVKIGFRVDDSAGHG